MYILGHYFNALIRTRNPRMFHKNNCAKSSHQHFKLSGCVCQEKRGTGKVRINSGG